MNELGDPSAGADKSFDAEDKAEFQLEVFVLAHGSQLLAYIRKIFPSALQPHYDPLDVFQTTAFEAFRRAGTFHYQNDDATLGWLFLLARRQIGMALRRERRHTPRSDARFDRDNVLKLLEAFAVDRRTPSQSALREETARAIDQGLRSLPPHLGQAVSLRYLQGLPMSQVAEEIGRSERAAAALCYRGLRLLQRKLRSFSRFM